MSTFRGSGQDDDLSQVSYTDTNGNALSIPTPSVNYTYDPNYNRMVTMADGIGTTQYSYYPVAANTLGAGQLYQIDGPFSNDTITYHYDELGRVISQDINGTASTTAYDSLGRIGTTTNPLGTFTRNYENVVTARLQTLISPNGQTANYTYFDNTGDRRLQRLQHLTAGSGNLSRHDYTYDAEGQIQTWNKTLGTNETDVSFGYDDAKRLLSAAQPGVEFDYDYDAAGNRLDATFHGTHIHGGSSFTVNNLNQLDSVSETPGIGPSLDASPITYDADGNMTYDGNNQTYEWDAANRLTKITYLDTGNRTEFAYDGLNRRVKITEEGPGIAATVSPPASGIYTQYSTAPFILSAGSYTLTFQGLNPDDATAFIDEVQLNDAVVPNGSFESPDLGGDGFSFYQYSPSDPAWSYVSAGITANDSAFTSANPNAPDGHQAAFVQRVGTISQTLDIDAGTYVLSFLAARRTNIGGLEQQVRVTVQQSSPTTTIKTLVWCGNQICEERDATGANVTKRFFAEGEQRIGGSDAGNYYYSRDHLGSIREVTDSTGALKAQLDYDAWGREVVVSGNMTIDFGFTGHYFHQPSGMNLAMYRAYNPTLGRWISRDPISENGGTNLYSYVENDPLSLLDPYGLSAQSRNLWLTIGATTGFVLSLPADALEDFFSGGTLIIANPATTAVMTAEGAAAGAWLDNILNSRASSPIPAGTRLPSAARMPESLPTTELRRLVEG